MKTATPTRFERFVENQGVVLFVWLLITSLFWFQKGPAVLSGLLPGNDDYMRLVQIRDWLGGQNWNDLHQYRLYPADPLLSHWARLTDILVAIPVKILTPFVGVTKAEIAASMMVPALFMLGFLGLLVAVTKTLYESRGVAVIVCILACLSFMIIQQFAPGRIDHHGLQLILMMACLLCLLGSEQRPALAALAGLLAGMQIWVGLESILCVAAACIAVTLNWVFDEFTARRRMRMFAIALATSAAFFLLISAPSTLWRVPYCDANSIVYVQLCVLFALAVVLLSAIGTKVHGVGPRLGLAAVFGILVIGITLMLFPMCAQGPYSQVDPRLADIWLANVSEAKGVIANFRIDPTAALSAIILPIFALMGWWVYNRYESSGWHLVPRTLLVFTLMTALTGLIQIRLISFAMATAVPFCAFLILYIFRSSEGLSGAKQWLVRAAALLIISPITIPLLIGPLLDPSPKSEAETSASADATKSETDACTSVGAMHGLKPLPAGFALTQIDLGAPILKHTHLSVSSAPYHRNNSGNLLGLDVFLNPAAVSRDLAKAAQSQYIILCRDFPETSLVVGKAPEGLAADLVAGRIPDWLAPIAQSDDSDLLVYSVLYEE